MTVRAIELTNFKGVGTPVRIELRPITLLFGANSAGKSTILQALLYAREVLERRNTDPDRTQQGGSHVDLGGFRTLVHNHDLTLSVGIRCELDLRSVDLSDYTEGLQTNPIRLQRGGDAKHGSLEHMSGLAESSAVSISMRWSELLEEPVQADYAVEINGTPMARIRTEPGSHDLHIIEFNTLHPWFLDFESSPRQDDGVAGSTASLVPKKPEPPEWQALRTLETSDQEITPRQIRSLFDEIQTLLDKHDLTETLDLGLSGGMAQFALIAPGRYLLEQLRQLLYLGPIREVPTRNYQPLLSPEESRWASGLGAWDWIYAASKERIALLNSWLTRGDRLNSGYRIDVKRYKEIDVDGLLMLALRQGSDLLDNYQAIREEIEARPTKARVVIRREEDFLEVSPQDIGIGISQVIPVLVAVLDESERITVIEQPELHIHPALQVALGDLFIESIRGEGLKRQLLLETHSEHLLLRLLRRVRETTDGHAPPRLMLQPDEVAIYFIESSADGMAIKRLGVDETGSFTDHWPRGFFDEREKEFFGEPGSISDEDLGRILGE